MGRSGGVEKKQNNLKKKEKSGSTSGSGGVQATSRKGCMKGKGGPLNASCTYKGVRQRTWGKWVSEIREPNHGARVWLGTFDTSTEAAVAYDKAARKLYGPDTKLNLPPDQQQQPSPRLPQLPRQIINHQKHQNQISSSSGTCSSSTSTDHASIKKGPGPNDFDVQESSVRFGDLALPEFDDSAIWEEAKATIDLHVIANELWNFWGDDFQLQNPWYY